MKFFAIILAFLNSGLWTVTPILPIAGVPVPLICG